MRESETKSYSAMRKTQAASAADEDQSERILSRAQELTAKAAIKCSWIYIPVHTGEPKASGGKKNQNKA